MPPQLRAQARDKAVMGRLDLKEKQQRLSTPPNSHREEKRWKSPPARNPFKLPPPAKRSRLDITAPTIWQDNLRRSPRLRKCEGVVEECPVSPKRRRAVVNEVKKAEEESASPSVEQSDKKEETENEEDAIVLPILSFSDEVLSLIFRRIARKERGPLALTCQRFHQVCLDLGSNRFATMRVDWTNLVQTVSGVIGETEFSFIGDATESQITSSDARVFRRAMVEALTVKFSKSGGVEQPVSPIVCNLLKTINYKSIQVHFDCEKDYNSKFINLLVNRRVLKDVPVSISWSRNCGHNIPRVRQMLGLLTRMDKLKLEWQLTDGRLGSYASITPDQCILNDELLSRLAIRTTEADLIAFGDYTVKGIMAAFDIVCRSKVKRKSICIHVRKELIDEIFSKDYNRFQANIKQGVVKYLYCPERQAVLTASFSKIWMQKRWTS